MGYFDQKTQRYHVIQKSNPIAPVAAGNAISYPQIFSGIDLNYTCGNTRLKEELVLSQSGRDALPDPSKFGIARTDAYLMLETEFALTPANLQAFARVGNGRVPIKQGNNFVFNGVDRIDFEDADSTLHFFFPEDVAYASADSANRISVTRVFSSQRGKDYVLVGVPFRWIDAAPKGTLIIDPTTTVATSEDVWLESTLNLDGHSAGLLVGKVAGGSKKRTIIKFNIAGSGIPASATVLNAQMKMYYYGTGGSAWVDRWLQAHQILVNWAEAQATSVNRLTGTAWNVAHVGLNDVDAKSSYESTLFFYLVGGQQVYGWKSWDLTSLTQKWVSGTATNYGVVLWATNETTDGKDLRFYSSEAAAPNDVNRPYLEVTYSQQAKTVYFLKDHLGSIRATVQDTLGAPVRGYDDYDPWGYILAGRSLASSILPTTTRNKFTEKEWDDEFGLNWNYFGARYYDPQIGRWMTRDPLAENHPNLTPYHYTQNNPLNRIDLYGLDDVYFDSAGTEIGRKKDSWWHNLLHSNRYYVKGSSKAPNTYEGNHYWEIEPLAAELLQSGQVSGVVEDFGPQMLEFVQSNLAEGMFPGNQSEVLRRSPGGQDWDFKKNLESKIYILGATGYLKDYIGNVTWGMIMAESGWPLQISLWGAGIQQNKDGTATANSWLRNFWNLGDDPRDSEAIQFGYFLVPAPTVRPYFIK